MYLITLFS